MILRDCHISDFHRPLWTPGSAQVEDVVPEMAHERSMRPQLLRLRRTSKQAGEQSMSRHGVACNTWQQNPILTSVWCLGLFKWCYWENCFDDFFGGRSLSTNMGFSSSKNEGSWWNSDWLFCAAETLQSFACLQSGQHILSHSHVSSCIWMEPTDCRHQAAVSNAYQSMDGDDIWIHQPCNHGFYHGFYHGHSTFQFARRVPEEPHAFRGWRIQWLEPGGVAAVPASVNGERGVDPSKKTCGSRDWILRLRFSPEKSTPGYQLLDVKTWVF